MGEDVEPAVDRGHGHVEHEPVVVQGPDLKILVGDYFPTSLLHLTPLQGNVYASISRGIRYLENLYPSSILFPVLKNDYIPLFDLWKNT